ncbi:MAG TPA: hypothetical protein VN733_00850, partial [Solirubrobacterales bacterium]|nr:hypothetical protein [Solirubrobacterales bacterium]
NSSGRQGPSPADLCVAEILGEQTVPMASFEPLARVGFLLLGQEQKAATYGQIAQRTGLKRRKVEEAMVAKPGVLTSCGSEHVRIESEAAVRVLGALEVGRRLLGGASPQELRGRTIYDACAPYVPAALSWLQRNSDVTDSPPGSLDGSIRAALRGRHAPYSFYATVVRSDSGGVLGDRVESLDQALFEQLISAIDEDRLQTCRDSLVKAGAQEPEFLLDPVLDQLFEVMAAYGGRAVELLLGLMENSEPLIRSQAAYLLLGWIRGVARDPGDEERQLLELIAERMPDRDGNLHFRFHQVEILESLQGAQALSGSASHSQVVSLLREIGADPGDSSERIDGYADFQALVSLHARALAGVTPPGPATAEMRDRLQRCVSILEAGGKFWESGDKAAIEESLECWEVCLGMAVRMCGAVRRNAFFASFIEGALEHDLWIVRWWAFSGMVGLVVRAAEAEESTLARRWAVRVVQQLFDGIEPIGTKHSQCAEIKRLRDGDGAAARIVREALLAVPAPIATERGRQELGERYYEVMGSSPDAYLGEFFRRLDGLSPRRNPLSASR